MSQKFNVNMIMRGAAGELTECPQCHAALEPDTQFCTNCGLNLKAWMAEQAAAEEAEAAPAPAENPAPIAEMPAFPENGFETIPQEQPAAPAFTPAEEEKTENAFPAFGPAKPVKATPAFGPAKPVEKPMPMQPAAPAVKPAMPVFAAAPIEDAADQVSPFAEGLPDWNIVPPQVPVRRKSK